jgi:hypothetical protein
MIIRGRNEFYDGWLAAFLALPRPDGEAAGVGWDSVDEVRNHPQLYSTFLAELNSGGIIIEL